MPKNMQCRVATAQFLSVKEVSSLLGVSESTCRRLVSKGEFEAIKANTAVRIEVASLERWIRSRRYIDLMQKKSRARWLRGLGRRHK